MGNEEQVSLALSHLADISIDDFFSQYWQVKPLIARQVFPGFSSPLEASEIAGLCIDEDVECRLVVQNQDAWRVTHGPLPKDIFSGLPEKDWTVLVQHADSLDPQVNALLDYFRFIPNWRLDDIMVSYAVDGGGVGPHFDYYDVFLVQAEGKRRWRLGQQCDSNTPLVPDQAMKIIEQFETQSEHVLEAGDVLYVPARTAHWGEAIGECITYSVGFRAPSHADFILDYSQELASMCNEDQRYFDEKLQRQHYPGLISDEALSTFESTFLRIGKDRKKLGLWLGQYSTQLKQDISGMYPALSTSDLKRDISCTIHPHARVAFIEDASDCVCFINGASAECSRSLAISLSQKEVLCFSQFDRRDRAVLEDLTHSGLIIALDQLAEYP